MSTLSKLSVAAATLALAAAPLAAQKRGPSTVPPGQLPPAGQCRVWYDNVPPGRQPAPTSCAAAERAARGSNARVVYGSGAARGADRNDRDDRNRRSDGRYDPRYPTTDSRYPSSSDSRGRVETDPRRRPSDETCRVRDRYGRCTDSVYDNGSAGNGGYGNGTYGNGGYGTTGSGVYGSRASNSYNLPAMLSLTALQRGQLNADYQRWLGNQRLAYRYTDADRDGWPERIDWYDSRDRLVQVWTDKNRDRRVDRVTVYENGRVARVVQ